MKSWWRWTNRRNHKRSSGWNRTLWWRSSTTRSQRWIRPNAPKVAKRMYQVNQVSKSKYRRSCNTPVDDVTKYGPVDGDPITETKEIPYETKREFDPKLAPGTEEVVQKVKMEKNNHNTNNENPLTNEKLVKVNQPKKSQRSSGWNRTLWWRSSTTRSQRWIRSKRTER